jgi:hypothetical protein
MTAIWRIVLVAFPAVVLYFSAGHLYRFSKERSDIWWTPKAIGIPLEASHHRVRVYLRGEELDRVIASRRLRLEKDGIVTPVSRTDIGLQFNNSDRVRIERIPELVIAGFTAGAATALLLVGLILLLEGLFVRK